MLSLLSYKKNETMKLLLSSLGLLSTTLLLAQSTQDTIKSKEIESVTLIAKNQRFKVKPIERFLMLKTPLFWQEIPLGIL